MPVCYSCGSEQHAFYAKENGFILVKCHGCGLLFVENRPDDAEISQAHKQGKHGGLKELEVTGVFDTDRQYDKVLKDLYPEGVSHIKTWLDVGCGHGEFMVAIQEFGLGKIAVTGSEPNVHKQESARKRNLTVDYFDLENHRERYNAISLLNVYSHLPNPPAFLRSIVNLLSPDGELVLQTGDIADLPANAQYKPFSLPDHLSFASEAILVSILERLNFEILNIKKYRIARPGVKNVVKEIVKLFLPQYKSKIRFYFMKPTNIFIRARVKN